MRLARAGDDDVRFLDTGGRAYQAALSPGGERAAIVDEGGVISLWDVNDEIEIGSVGNGISVGLTEPRWSPDGDTVTIVGSSEIVQLETDPNRWAEAACELIGRAPSQRSWETHAPPGIALPPDCPFT